MKKLFRFTAPIFEGPKYPINPFSARHFTEAKH